METNNRPIQPMVNGIPAPDMDRRSRPHIAIVTMKVDVRAINPDNTLDLYTMGDGCLSKYGLSQKGQFVVKGYSEADCIQKLQQILESINGKT